MYRQRMVDIGMPPAVQVNRTRLEERLLLNCPHLTATKHGREIFFIVDCNTGQAVTRACSMGSDIKCLEKAGNVIRTHFRKIRSLGTDKISAQRVDVFANTGMLLEGPNIKDQLHRNKIRRNAGLTIAQLLVFNSRSSTEYLLSTDFIIVLGSYFNFTKKSNLVGLPDCKRKDKKSMKT